ncbi:MAG: CHAT domain-containing protein [Bacteroidota bacterium]
MAFANASWFRLALAGIGLGSVAIVLLLGQRSPSEAFSGMPAEQRVYWEWVTQISADPALAIEVGSELVQEYADFGPFYTRLAQVCTQESAQAQCVRAFERAVPRTQDAVHHRAASLLLLQASEAAPEQWLALAGELGLTSPLARLITDQLRRLDRGAHLADLQAVWENAAATDTAHVAAHFGAGYVATLRNDYEHATPLLHRATRLNPDDAEAYRELGRIYYRLGQADDFDMAVRNAIAAAERTHRLDVVALMQGNLGWTLHQRDGKTAAARELIESSLTTSDLLNDGATQGMNWWRLANLSLADHRYDEALALLDSAEAYHQQATPTRIARVTASRGFTNQAMLRLSDAERLLEKAVAQSKEFTDYASQLQALSALAQLRYRMGRYESARTIALEALDLARRARQTDAQIGMRIILAELERFWGNFDQARFHLEEAIAQARETGNVTRIREAQRFMSFVALNMQDLNTAKELLDTTTADTALVSAVDYLQMGRLYYHFGNFEQALSQYEQAKAHLTGNPKTQVDLAVHQGWALIKTGRVQDAIDLIEATLPESQAYAAGHVQLMATIAEAYGELGEHTMALSHFERAEQLELDLRWPSLQWRILLGKATMQWRLNELEQAEASFRQSISIVETLRDNLNSLERSFFVQNKGRVYEYFSMFLDEQGRHDEAFHFAERGRSRSLVDLLYTTQYERQLDENTPQDRIVEWNRRMQALNAALQPSDVLEDVETSGTLRGTRASYLRREYQRADSIYKDAEIALASVNKLYTFNPISADSLQRVLRAGEAMVMYNLREVEDAEETVAYVIDPEQITAVPLMVDQDALQQSVRFFRDRLSDGNQGPGTRWEAISERLHSELIAPVQSHLSSEVEHLHLVPEGVLHYLPFAALRSAEGRFLIEEYTLSVVPSATVLQLARERNPQRWRSMLLLADPNDKLAGARSEVRSIVAQSPNRRHELTDELATQAQFEDVAMNYDIIHMATHGAFVPRAPWLSHLELYGDEVLSVSDIGSLRLDAYLVTLSACETALSGGAMSDIPNGDEWVGMNQAFLAAGTPTVMASLWAIDDAVSSPFMVGFYDNLGPGGKAQALATMQRRFIRDASTNHPFYWSAFTLIGDPL